MNIIHKIGATSWLRWLGGMTLCGMMSVAVDAGMIGAVSSKPNNIYVLDLDAYKIIRRCTFPGSHAMGALVMAPDSRTAYVTANGTNTIFGVDLETCEVTFRADQSEGDVRVRNLSWMAVSKDGSELYSIQHRTHLLIDRYDVMDPVLAVYDTSAGLEAKPVRTFPLPRQVSGVVEAGKEGLLYVMGPDVLTVNPDTGEVKTVAVSRSWERPLYSPSVGVYVTNNAMMSGEFNRPYVVLKFADESMDMMSAAVQLGITRVDIETGAVSSAEFSSNPIMLFSIVSHPTKPNLVYGICHKLIEYDIDTVSEKRSLDLPHNYYGIGISPDGERLFLSGAMNIISAYDTETLEPLGRIEIEGDMVFSSLQMVSR